MTHGVSERAAGNLAKIPVENDDIGVLDPHDVLGDGQVPVDEGHRITDASSGCDLVEMLAKVVLAATALAGMRCADDEIAEGRNGVSN